MSDRECRLPEHLAPLVPPDWALWKWFALRGSGFPAHLAASLSDRNVAGAADHLTASEAAVQALCKATVQPLNLRLDELRQQGIAVQDAVFKTALRARRRALAAVLSPVDAREAGLNELASELEKALAELEQARRDFQTAFEHGIERQSLALREAAAHPRFQEAVLWQNRHAFETAVRPLSLQAETPRRNQRQREHEQLIANYLQRYCAKNDTIGFFGPVAWGEMAVGNPALEARPGPNLVHDRTTYFEDWAIDLLATALSSIPGMDWWSPVRLVPYFRLEAGRLHIPGQEPMPLDPLGQAALPLCNGENAPAHIFRAMQEDGVTGVGRQQLLSFLRSMADQNILLWRFLVPVEVNSEASLRRQLLRIEDAGLRAMALERLDRLEDARRAVHDAAGDTPRLHSAIRELERTFEELTQAPGQRNAGTTYGGRTLMYEDCRRDLKLRASPDLLRPVIPAFQLLLQSLRWLMQSTSLWFLHHFRQVYHELAETSGCRDVSALDWWAIAEPRLIADPAIHEAEQVFVQKWQQIIPLQPDAHLMQVESHNLKALVEQAFPDLPGYFHPIRYYCPDLMIAGSDAEAIGRGEGQYVLGEMHSGKNSLIHAALVAQHPDVSELISATEWDLAPTCLKIAESRAEGKTTTRTSELVLRPGDYFLSTTPDAVAPSGFISHPFSELVVTERDGQLLAATRDGSRTFEILEALSDLLFSFVVHKAAWMPRAPHVPRVAIDRLIIHRETWRVPVDDLGFAAEKDETLRFLGARRWACSNGIPEKFFVKIPTEIKPFYIDLASPVFADILCKMVRRLQASSTTEKEVTLSEILPLLADAWLPDASGARYTSEFRFSMVDLKARALSEEYKERYATAAVSNF